MTYLMKSFYILYNFEKYKLFVIPKSYIISINELHKLAVIIKYKVVRYRIVPTPTQIILYFIVLHTQHILGISFREKKYVGSAFYSFQPHCKFVIYRLIVRIFL